MHHRDPLENRQQSGNVGDYIVLNPRDACVLGGEQVTGSSSSTKGRGSCNCRPAFALLNKHPRRDDQPKHVIGERGAWMIELREREAWPMTSSRFYHGPLFEIASFKAAIRSRERRLCSDPRTPLRGSSLVRSDLSTSSRPQTLSLQPAQCTYNEPRHYTREGEKREHWESIRSMPRCDTKI